MEAERDTVERYLAAYLADQAGAEFTGRISGVARFGLFVKLDETGADGLIPVSSLGREYFRYDQASQTLSGEETGLVLGLGQMVTVRPGRGGAGHRWPDPGAAVGGRRQAPPTAQTPLHGTCEKRRLTRDRIARAKAARKERRRD